MCALGNILVCLLITCRVLWIRSARTPKVKIESGVTPGEVMLGNFYGSIEIGTACVINVEASIVLIARNYFEIT
jgi:hypothetical protein